MVELPGLNFSPAASMNYPFLLGLKPALRQMRPDIIDCQSHLFLTAPQSVSAARQLGIPVVITINGIIASRGLLLNSAQKLSIRTVVAAVFRRASVVRCLTSSDALEAMRYGCPRGKIRIIPNGVDTSLFSPPLGRREAPPVVAWVGRFVGEKDLPTLVRAASVIIKEHHDARFVLLGDGPLRPLIESMARHMGIAQNFEFTGALDHQAVASWLRRSAVFAFPSLKEGMPLALLEAMSCGNPVAGTDIPGISSVVRDGESGIIVQKRNPESLAKAILLLLSDEKLRERMGSNARKEIIALYSQAAVIKLLESAYADAIEL
jgi:glycosyltransferase involved in cell wall biosynthesis